MCSLSVEPDSKVQGYAGKQLSTFQKATNIYFQANPEMAENDEAIKKLEKFFEGGFKYNAMPTQTYLDLGKDTKYSYVAIDYYKKEGVRFQFRFQEGDAKAGKALTIDTGARRELGAIKEAAKGLSEEKMNLEFESGRRILAKKEVLTVPELLAGSHDNKLTATEVQASTSDADGKTTKTKLVNLIFDNIQFNGDGKLYYIIEKSHKYVEDPEDPGYYNAELVLDS